MTDISNFQNFRNPALAAFAKQMAAARAQSPIATNNLEAQSNPEVGKSEMAINSQKEIAKPNISNSTQLDEGPRPDKPFRKGMVLDIRV